MNKNSKAKLQASRSATREGMSRTESGRKVISINDPKIARGRYANGCMVVYHNTDQDGKKTSITRHESTTDVRAVCRTKVGGKSGGR